MSERVRDPDAACRTAYRTIARRCRRQGIDAAAAARSAVELSHPQGHLRVLDESAFQPTGLALGCPLPDRRVTRRLWRVARLVERRLAALAPGAEAVFAHVPVEAYHLTVVNRTHYAEDAKVSALSREEAEEARRIVRRQSRRALALQLHGLIVSRAGLLLAPGYPANDDFYELRLRLAQEMPVLQKHLPGMAHLKLGHVLVPLAGEPLRELLGWLRACGELVSARLVFRDLYTPHGRIDL